VLGLSAGALVSPWLRAARAADAGASTAAEIHGLSVFGDLKYPADFQHFDYVNLDAPKGGIISLLPGVRTNNQSYFTFNSLNAFILKGEGAQGMDLTFATLLTRAGDEPDAAYGYAAKSVQVSPDRLVYRFTMRPEARFHDGSKLTAQDVAFSLMIVKEKGHPLLIQQLREMVKAEAPDDATVVVTFAEKHARDVPLFAASLPIFSKAYYANRAFDESTLDTPLGSGPYKVGKFEVNRFIDRRSIRRSAPARTRSASSRSTASSNSTASRTGGARICPSVAASSISPRSATSSTATATSPSRGSRRRAICTARSSPRGSGRRATTSRRSRTAGSSARSFPMIRPPARRAGSSTRAASSSPIRACAKR
jgi:hypothetical protein